MPDDVLKKISAMIEPFARATMFVNSVTTKCGGPKQVSATMDIGIITSVSLSRAVRNEALQGQLTAETTFSVNGVCCTFPFGCSSEKHTGKRKPLTTPTVLVITRNSKTKLVVQQTLTMQDFRGVTSTYELQAMICRGGTRNEHNYSAEIRTVKGWTRCDDDVAPIPDRDSGDLPEVPACVMFFKRTAPRPEYVGPPQTLVDSIRTPRPFSTMHGCIRELARLPEFFVSNAECVEADRSCTICMSGVNPEDPIQHFRALPCGHFFHEECIVKIVNQSEKCPECRLVY